MNLEFETAFTVFAMVFYGFMFIMGAAIGSFLTCQARRLRRKELGRKKLGKRSVCLKCKHQLKWYENVPIVSWLVLRGKCRYCHKKIGVAEIMAEILTAVAFVVVAIVTPKQAWMMILNLMLMASLIFLAIYDGLYGELPTFALAIAGVLTGIVVVMRILGELWSGGKPGQMIINIVLAGLILGGLYLLLYLVSKGKWVGDGDWVLALIIGIMLGAPFAALVALFVANLLATLVSLPAAVQKKTHKIYFGPFLVAGYAITLALCAIIKI